MKQFLKFTLATIVGIFLFTIISVFVLAGIAAAAGGKKQIEVPANSVLKLDLNYSIPEQTTDNPFQDIDFSSFKPKSALGLLDVLKTIELAKNDKNIAGIYLPMGINTNGFATLESIRNQLIDFKKSGKFVYAYGVVTSQKSYYLASVADKVFLDKNGYLELRGMGTQITYFKNAFDKAGIEVQEFHVGSFKSAIEPFIRTNMSEPNREQLTMILGDLQNHFVKGITEQRKISAENFQNMLDSLKATNAEECKALGLIDEALYYDQLLNHLKDKTGVKAAKDVELVELNKYAGKLDKEDKSESANKIAVVVLEGNIVDGEGQEDEIGGDRVAKLLRKLREDEKVKSIVMRVNSPGGSAVASDLIWREVTLAKEHKPVVVSFGNVAASGGYYISCAADRIFVQPNTITGSIGVFGLIPNFKKLMNEKIGVTTDEVALSKHANFGGGLKPLDAFESTVIQKEVEHVYTTFRQRVADGRKTDTAAIEKIAQGRVWTGTQAIERNLADEIGNLDNAIAFAAKKASLKDYKVKVYPEEKSFAEKISESFGEMKTSWVKEALGEQYEIFNAINRLKKTSGVQCRMPLETESL
ncbi:MAG: signal peptide peptidase SppA [Chitinophagales bacterium]|nr:signal peptide peptidase SppA [Chitinophagales bacterium]